MEPATGLEPATGSLQNCYATIASCRHTKVRVELLYDNNPDSQSSSHKRYNHQHQDRAEHVTHPNTAEGIRDAPVGSYAFRLSHRPAFIIVNANKCTMLLFYASQPNRKPLLSNCRRYLVILVRGKNPLSIERDISFGVL